GLDASAELDGDVVAAVLVDGADRQGAGEPGERAGARAGGDDVAQLGLAARHGAELLEGDGALAAVERALEELGGDVGGAARGRVAGGEHHALRGALERAGPGLRQVEAVGGAGEGLCGGQGDGEGRGAVIGAGAHVSSIRAAWLRRTCSLASSAYCIASSQRPLRCRVSSRKTPSRRRPIFSITRREARFSAKQAASTRRTPSPSKAMRSSAAANSVPSPLPWAEGSRTQPSSACCPAARSHMSVWEQASCRSTLPTATTAPSCRPTTAEPSLDSQRSRCAASVGLSVVVHSWTSGSRYQGQTASASWARAGRSSSRSMRRGQSSSDSARVIGGGYRCDQ